MGLICRTEYAKQDLTVNKQWPQSCLGGVVTDLSVRELKGGYTPSHISFYPVFYDTECHMLWAWAPTSIMPKHTTNLLSKARQSLQKYLFPLHNFSPLPSILGNNHFNRLSFIIWKSATHKKLINNQCFIQLYQGDCFFKTAFLYSNNFHSF